MGERSGLLLAFNEVGLGIGIGRMFQSYRSFEEWWEQWKPTYTPEFVEFVEEQRSKAA